MGTRNTALLDLSSRSALSRSSVSTACRYSCWALSLTSAMRLALASSVRSAKPRIFATSVLRRFSISTGSLAITFKLLSVLYQFAQHEPLPSHDGAGTPEVEHRPHAAPVEERGRGLLHLAART